jgi:hypothetical protein
MSLKVAVVCEDHTNDQYIVGPALSALLSHLGRPKARLQIVTNPRLQGLSSLIKDLCSIIARYSAAADIVIVVVDGDCKDGRRGTENRHQRLTDLVANCLTGSDKTAVVIAIQEVEVWALWGQRDKLGVDWTTVRAECDPKERFFNDLLTKDDLKAAGGGRLRLMKASLERGWPSLRAGCSELQALEDEIVRLLGVPGENGSQ